MSSASSGMTIDKSIIAANPIVGQTSSTSQSPKNTTISSLVGALPEPKPANSNSNSNSWSAYSPFNQKQESFITQARKAEHWEGSSTTTSEDDDSGLFGRRTPPAGFSTTQNIISIEWHSNVYNNNYQNQLT